MHDPAVAVVGGGINGAGIAWELVRRGYRVTLFDQSAFGAQTSAASSKLIHGGLRYLEQLEFRQVREGLRERAWLLEHAPHLVHSLEILLPQYADSPRPRWMVALGLTLYDGLAGRRNLARHRSLTAGEICAAGPLKRAGLGGGFSFLDGQTDDHLLVRTVVASARRDGLAAYEFSPVERIERRGLTWWLEAEPVGRVGFDLIVLALGPWMNKFLTEHRIPHETRLTLVRGSHIILNRKVSDRGFLLPSRFDRRVFFVLPWKSRTLVGTTEVPHESSLEIVTPAPREISYLLRNFNSYFDPAITERDIDYSFAGVRPLVGSGHDLGRISRDSAIETGDRLVKVFGGKLTSFMALGRKVANRVDEAFAHPRTAGEAVFERLRD